jgi:hypothetical protein
VDQQLGTNENRFIALLSGGNEQIKRRQENHSPPTTHWKEKTMKTIRSQKVFAIALLAAVAFTTAIARAAAPLPSWNDGPAK